MKKRIFCLLTAALLLLAAVSACAKQGGGKPADVEKIADEIIRSVKFSDQMSALEKKTAVKLYGLDEADVAKAKVYESTGATAEEVAAFEAKDEAAAKRIRAAAAERVEDQKAAFADYQPREMTKLKTPLLVQDGKYVLLVVADDISAARKVAGQYLTV